MIADFQPWQKYPDLTEERLSLIATEVRDVRQRCVELHRPEDGDGNWSLSCRAYERTFNAIRRLSTTLDWLAINPELKPLQFSFSIGMVPLRFYKGDPEEPPSRYLNLTFGEESWRQMSFDFDGRPAADVLLRLAVEVASSQEVASISLVEIDEFKVPAAAYRIPFGAASGNLVAFTPSQVAPVALPPALASPRRDKKLLQVKIPDAVTG